MFYLWRNLGKPTQKRKSRKRTSGNFHKRPSSYSPKRRTDLTVTVTVELIIQTEKAIKINNDRGETAWIPRYWVLKKKEIGEDIWQIETKKHQWEGKFPGKPK